MKLVVRNISQSFGDTKALNNVSFELPKGKIFGFVGPNGAGKTTLLRILSGIDVPDNGDAYWNNKSLIEYPEFLRKEVGYMPDLLPSIPDITVLNYLDFYASAFGYKGISKDEILLEAIKFAELDSLENSFIGNLSKGQKQLVSLGRIFIHNPNLIILDEPAAGLDPQNRLKLSSKLKIWNQQGKTIFISSHILSELEDLVDGVVIIDKGRIIKAGFLSDIAKENKVEDKLKLNNSETVILTLAYFEDATRWLNLLQSLEYVLNVKIIKDKQFEVEIKEDTFNNLLIFIDTNNMPIAELKRPKHLFELEEIYLESTKDKVVNSILLGEKG